ncbi:MAG TPA: hypothetical protein VHY30_04475 [Verrucomicrobiae bacterium]|jgi:hypothetical protein|nr:hypothetical protein [Verrucomicrobiae bacterium]
MKKFLTMLFVCTVSVRLLAMDRFAALSQVESGDNDRAIGRAGEISRYQIRRDLWIGGNPRDAHMALVNAQSIMAVRVAGFAQRTHRAPTDLEFYVLWNAPAQINRPHAVVAARAQRFANLCEK